MKLGIIILILFHVLTFELSILLLVRESHILLLVRESHIATQI